MDHSLVKRPPIPNTSPFSSDERLLLEIAEQEIDRLKQDFQALESLVLERIDESDSEKLKSLGALYTRLRAEFDALSKEPAPASKELIAERNALTDQLSVLRQEVRGLEQQLKEAIRSRKEAERRLQVQETAHENMLRERMQLDQDLRHRTARVNELQEGFGRARQEIERLRAAERTIRMQLETEQRSSKALGVRVNTLLEALAGHEEEKKNNENVQKSLLSHITDVQRRYEELTQRCETLTQNALDAQQLADEAGDDRARLLAEIEMLRARPLPSDSAREYVAAFTQVETLFKTLAGHAQSLERSLTEPISTHDQAPRMNPLVDEVPRIQSAIHTLTEAFLPLDQTRARLEERYQQLKDSIRQSSLDLRTMDRGSNIYAHTSNILSGAEQELASLQVERTRVLDMINVFHDRIQLLHHRLDAYKTLEEPLDPLLTLPVVEEHPPIVTVSCTPLPPLGAMPVDVQPIRPFTLTELELQLQEAADLTNSSVTTIIAITLLKTIRQRQRCNQLLVTTETLFGAAMEIGILDEAFCDIDFQRIETELQSLYMYVTKTVIKGKTYFPFLPNKHLPWKTFITPEKTKDLIAHLRAQE